MWSRYARKRFQTSLLNAQHHKSAFLAKITSTGCIFISSNLITNVFVKQPKREGRADDALKFAAIKANRHMHRKSAAARIEIRGKLGAKKRKKLESMKKTQNNLHHYYRGRERARKEWASAEWKTKKPCTRIVLEDMKSFVWLVRSRHGVQKFVLHITYVLLFLFLYVHLCEWFTFKAEEKFVVRGLTRW